MDDEFEGLGFNPSELLAQLRKSASVKAGAVMFGQAQIAYYDTLKESSMSDEEAYNMLAHTTAAVVRGVFSAVGPVCEVLLKAAAMMEYFESLGIKTKSDKQVPGE